MRADRSKLSSRDWSFWLLSYTALALLQGLGTTRAAVLGIDLGSEFLKISLVKSGRAPISIVLNEMSKRKTASQVAYINGDRMVGEEAAAVQSRYPEMAIGQLCDFLGVQADSAHIKALQATQRLPYKVVPTKDRGTVAFQVGEGDPVTIEEVVASLLQYAQKLAVASAEGASVPDAVIAVPAWFGQSQRRALLDAAQLAGLNVLSLINDHAAAALKYGIERSFVNKTEHVIFYDMGYSATEVALVKYSSFAVKEGSKTNSYGQFEVIDTASAFDVGSSGLDAVLMEHLASEFNSQHMTDGSHVLEHPKAVAKLRKQVKRLKQVLSANTESSMSVEELHRGIDFKSHITRQAFEKLAGDFFDKAAAPLAALLARNPEAVRNISLEVLGGGIRVPRLQAVIKQTLGGQELSKKLDADEAIVLGAALFAANLSTTFRLRKFGFSDGISYPLAYQVEEGPNIDNADGTAFDAKLLGGFLKKMPVRRVVHLPNATADPVNLKLLSGEPIPGTKPSDMNNVLGSFSITGIDDVIKKHGRAGKLSTHWTVSTSGIATLDRAEAVLERMEMVNITVLLPANETGNSTNATVAPSKGGVQDANASTAGNDTTTPAPATKVVQRERKRVTRVPLTVGGAGYTFPGLTADQMQVLSDRMAILAASDKVKAEAAGAKNALESYILSTRGAMNDDEGVAAVTTEAQRAAFVKQLDSAEEWLYEGGEDAAAEKHRDRLNALKVTGDPITFRTAEASHREAVQEKATKFAELVSMALSTWPDDRPWINATDIAAFSTQLDQFQKWLAAQTAAQSKVASHVAPVWTSSDAFARLDVLKKAYAQLKSTPRPAPLSAPPTNGTADSNGTASNSTDAPATKADTAKKSSRTSDGGDKGRQTADTGSSRSWEQMLKDMTPANREKMEALLKPGPNGGGAKLFNADDMEGMMNFGAKAKDDQATGETDSNKDDGLERHTEL